MQKIRVWDLPIRLFHWLLLVSIGLLWLTAEQGELVARIYSGIESTRIHAAIGYWVLGLILFRIVWGFIGSETARFTQFVKGPSAVIRYIKANLRKEKVHTVGHNPAGALMVIALLLIILVQLLTGLCAHDDVSFEGPLMPVVGEEVSHLCNRIHHLNFNILLAAVAVHIAAIVYYRFVKRDDLITPMIKGVKEMDEIVESPRQRPLWMALSIAMVVGCTVWGLLAWAGTLPPLE